MKKRNNILFVPKGKRIYGLTKDFKIHILEAGSYKIQKYQKIYNNYNHFIFNSIIERIFISYTKENNDKKLISFITDIKFKKFKLKSNKKNLENKDTTNKIINECYIISEKYGFVSPSVLDYLNDYFGETKYIFTDKVDKHFEESLNILKDFKFTDNLLNNKYSNHSIFIMYIIYNVLLRKEIFDILIKNESPEYFLSQYKDINKSIEGLVEEIIKMSQIDFDNDIFRGA